MTINLNACQSLVSNADVAHVLEINNNKVNRS